MRDDETLKKLELALRELVDALRREDARLTRIELLAEKIATAMGIAAHG